MGVIQNLPSGLLSPSLDWLFNWARKALIYGVLTLQEKITRMSIARPEPAGAKA